MMRRSKPRSLQSSRPVKNQCELVLDYMKRNGGITAAEAFLEIGVGRLAARIHDLKEDGVSIEREMIEVEKKDGTTAEVARYSIGVPIGQLF